MISTFHTPTRIGLRKDHHLKSYPDCCGEGCQFRCVLNLSETEILAVQEKTDDECEMDVVDYQISETV